MPQVFVALGANLAEPVQQLTHAVDALQSIALDKSVVVSPFYTSAPMGEITQPDYVNAVAKFDTDLSAIALLDALQLIEQQQGRVRLQHWGPRTLDLDILLYANDIIQTPRLVVPHYGMQQRSFVLVPLQDIEPNLTLPCGTLLNDLVTAQMRNELQKITA